MAEKLHYLFIQLNIRIYMNEEQKRSKKAIIKKIVETGDYAKVYGEDLVAKLKENEDGTKLIGSIDECWLPRPTCPSATCESRRACYFEIDKATANFYCEPYCERTCKGLDD
ncbi:MAG: hypothetical protein V3V78_00300 [Candidatus Woesearchaeota archaeon]